MERLNPLTFFINYIKSDRIPKNAINLFNNPPLDSNGGDNELDELFDLEGCKAYNSIIDNSYGLTKKEHKNKVLHFLTDLENLQIELHRKDTQYWGYCNDVLNKIILHLDLYCSTKYGLIPKDENRQKAIIRSRLLGSNDLNTFQLALMYAILNETGELILPSNKTKTFIEIEEINEISQGHFKNLFYEAEKFVRGGINAPKKRNNLIDDIRKVINELSRFQTSHIYLEEDTTLQDTYPKSIVKANEILDYYNLI